MTLQSKLLIVGALPAGLHKALSQNFELFPLWTVEDRASFLQTHQGQFAGGVTMSRYGCQADVFACLRDRVLVCFGLRRDHITPDRLAVRCAEAQFSTPSRRACGIRRFLI